MSAQTGRKALEDLLALPQAEKEIRGLLHTPQEIYQQPATWKTTYELFRTRKDEVREFLLAAGIRKDCIPPTVMLVGAGSSDYVGRSLTHLLRKQWRCEVLAVPSTDLITNLDDLILPGRQYLWISLSRSGDSPEGVTVLEQALEHHSQIRHLIITCNRDGQIAQRFSEHQNVCCLVLDDAVNDRGLAMTSSFSNMVIAGQCLAHTHDLAEYRVILEMLCEAGQNFLDLAAEISAHIAAEGYTRGCFVGTGPLRAIAQESALKVLELTAGRIQTMSESSLGLRHGPLSALNNETLLVSFLSSDARLRAYELGLLEEIKLKRLCRTVVTVSSEPHARLDRSADCVLTSTSVADEYRPPVDVMLGQLLGLFSSLHHGLKPDEPSPNGAISRVVSQLNL
jgi:tagatose-6-phosphate ketose/aldose isomerase